MTLFLVYVEWYRVESGTTVCSIVCIWCATSVCVLCLRCCGCPYCTALRVRVFSGHQPYSTKYSNVSQWQSSQALPSFLPSFGTVAAPTVQHSVCPCSQGISLYSQGISRAVVASGVIPDRRVSFHGRFIHFYLPSFLPSFLRYCGLSSQGISRAVVAQGVIPDRRASFHGRFIHFYLPSFLPSLGTVA